MQYCSKCGNPVQDQSKFCKFCGNPIENIRGVNDGRKKGKKIKPMLLSIIVSCVLVVSLVACLIYFKPWDFLKSDITKQDQQNESFVNTENDEKENNSLKRDDTDQEEEPSNNTEKHQTNENIVAQGTLGKNVTWILSEDGVLTISGNGVPSDEKGLLEEVMNTIPVYEVIVEEGITDLGDVSFYMSRTIEKVQLPGSMEEVGSYSFAYCSSLWSVTFGEGIKKISDHAFYDCDSLNSLTTYLPDSLEIIGSAAFAYCDTMLFATIPQNVHTIGPGAFGGGTMLHDLYVEEGNEFYSEVDGVLYNNEKDTLIQYPSGRSGIATVPEGVKCIYESAFFGCGYIDEINLPQSLEEIQDAAFSNCDGIYEILIPKYVNTIGYSVFSGCYNLYEINVETGYNSPYLSIDGVLYAVPGASLALVAVPPAQCVKDEIFSVEDGTTIICSYAFASCSNLTSIRLPSSLHTVDDHAFNYCYNLDKIYYAGASYEQWQNISISEYGNDYLQWSKIYSGAE